MSDRRATTTATAFLGEEARLAREFGGDMARLAKQREKEIAALQKRCEEAERERDALRRDASQEIATDEMVRRLQHLGDWQAADRIEALQKRVAELRQIIRYVAGCEPATASDEDLLEQVAAAICRMNDIDPTGHISIDGSPFNWAWKHFLPQARAALAGGKDE